MVNARNKAADHIQISLNATRELERTLGDIPGVNDLVDTLRTSLHQTWEAVLELASKGSECGKLEPTIDQVPLTTNGGNRTIARTEE